MCARHWQVSNLPVPCRELDLFPEEVEGCGGQDQGRYAACHRKHSLSQYDKLCFNSQALIVYLRYYWHLIQSQLLKTLAF
jgi:hypothetical protein